MQQPSPLPEPIAPPGEHIPPGRDPDDPVPVEDPPDLPVPTVPPEPPSSPPMRLDTVCV